MALVWRDPSVFAYAVTYIYYIQSMNVNLVLTACLHSRSQPDLDHDQESSNLGFSLSKLDIRMLKAVGSRFVPGSQGYKSVQEALDRWRGLGYPKLVDSW